MLDFVDAVSGDLLLGDSDSDWNTVAVVGHKRIRYGRKETYCSIESDMR